MGFIFEAAIVDKGQYNLFARNESCLSRRMRRLNVSNVLIMYVLLGICFIASCAANLVSSSRAVKYEPYTVIKRNKLIGLFGFDGDSQNVIPFGESALSNRYCVLIILFTHC